MAIEVEIDVRVLKSEIKKTYASVSQEPEKDFIFPTGRPWAEDLGYPHHRPRFDALTGDDDVNEGLPEGAYSVYPQPKE